MRVEQCRGKFQRDEERVNAGRRPLGIYGWTMIDWANVPPSGDKCCGCLCPCDVETETGINVVSYRGRKMSDIIRVSMVMDASQDRVRRYWSGHGWVTDPLKAVKCSMDLAVAYPYYRELVQAGCQVALVVVNLSVDDGVIVHSIRVLEKTTWRVK